MASARFSDVSGVLLALTGDDERDERDLVLGGGRRHFV